MTEQNYYLDITIYSGIIITDKDYININKIIKEFNLTDIWLNPFDSTIHTSTHKTSCNLSKPGSYHIISTNNNMIVGLGMIITYLQYKNELFAKAEIAYVSMSDTELQTSSTIKYNKYFKNEFGFNIKPILLINKSSKKRPLFIVVPENIYDNKHLYCWDDFNVDLFNFNLTPEELMILKKHSDTSMLLKNKNALRSFYSLGSTAQSYLKQNEQKYNETKSYFEKSLNMISNPISNSLITKDDISFMFKKELESQKILLIKETIEYFSENYGLKINKNSALEKLKNIDYTSENIADFILNITNGIPPHVNGAITESTEYFIKELFKDIPLITNAWENSISFFNVFDINKNIGKDSYNINYLKSIFASIQLLDNEKITNFTENLNQDLQKAYAYCGKEENISDYNRSYLIENCSVGKIAFSSNGKITIFFKTSFAFNKYISKFMN